MKKMTTQYEIYYDGDDVDVLAVLTFDHQDDNEPIELTLGKSWLTVNEARRLADGLNQLANLAGPF